MGQIAYPKGLHEEKQPVRQKSYNGKKQLKQYDQYYDKKNDWHYYHCHW